MNIEKFDTRLYDKKNDSDLLEQIIQLHFIDIMNGNNRDSINYVDVLYPSVEKLFTCDVCMEALFEKGTLRTYYNNEYDLSKIDYDSLLDYYQNAKETCSSIKDEKRIVKISDQVKNTISEICTKKIKESKKM